MDEATYEHLFSMIEKYGDMTMTELRKLASSGQDGKYSRQAAKAELAKVFFSRGKLMRWIIEGEFECDLT